MPWYNIKDINNIYTYIMSKNKRFAECLRDMKKILDENGQEFF